MKEPGNPGVDRIELLQTYVRIVETGSLSAAARELGTTQPTISRRLQALERLLGLRLLQRSTHVMKTTLDGERCYAHAKGLLASWHAMDAELRGMGDEPEGTLRVLAPHAFGQEQLIEPLAAYLRRYPRVQVEWLLHDRRPDYIAEGIDCAIQVGMVDDPSVVAIQLAQVSRIVVAAPGLLEGLPTPRHPRDLAALPWLAMRTFYQDEVALTRQRDDAAYRFPIRPKLSTDSLYALRNAAAQGLGAALVSEWLMLPDLRQKRLVHLVPEWRGLPLPVYLVYPYARFYPARLRLFLQAMRTTMPEILS
ncbi:LysR family transcriptional regulator [Bordetella flabilis]|uniref:LysR family transcriptional regulator n=1 Tax=Bordetella flabilis TaxID=463014 RepID=A0A193GMB0_9BORD|nr:LysR family transcriptional regulator [Bordetella flabilis]ANN80439.1 LysR family transcriptional regulator [Bordetella flabilis]